MRWMIPTLLLIVLTPFTSYIDISIAHFFYPFSKEDPFFQFMYTYGFYFAWIALVIAIIFYTLSFFKERFLPWRCGGKLMILVFILGPALTVNAILKEHWGRPRPRQIVAFEGKYPYHPYYQPSFHKYNEPLKSFPSGHVSMGFYFFALAIAGKRMNNRSLHILGYVFAYGLGISLGITRMAMGGHFFTDVLLSAYLLWIITLFAEWLIYERADKKTT